MKEINFNSRLEMNGNSLIIDGKAIGKWWGKTLYYYKKDANGNNDKLYYHNFSIIGLFFHCLGYKSKFNSQDLAKSLKDKNITVQNTPNKPQQTPKTKESDRRKIIQLFHNLERKDNEIIELFKSGMNVNMLTHAEVNETVLMMTSGSPYRQDLTKYLIENGANVNVTTNDGSGLVAKTPLQNAILHETDNITILLLAKDADVNTVNAYGKPVLQQAIERFVSKKTRNLAQNDASKSNPKKIIQEILKKPVEINQTDKDGLTALYHAIDTDELEIIQWIIDKGADVNYYDTNGLPPILKAIEKGNINVIRLLIQNGAKVNIQQTNLPSGKFEDQFYKNPRIWDSALAIAIGCKRPPLTSTPNPEIIELLIKEDANCLNQTCQCIIDDRVRMATPLHIAASRCDLSTVKLLIANGADINAKDSKGQTAKEYAQNLSAKHAKGSGIMNTTLATSYADIVNCL